MTATYYHLPFDRNHRTFSWTCTPSAGKFEIADSQAMPEDRENKHERLRRDESTDIRYGRLGHYPRWGPKPMATLRLVDSTVPC